MPSPWQIDVDAPYGFIVLGGPHPITLSQWEILKDQELRRHGIADLAGLAHRIAQQTGKSKGDALQYAQGIVFALGTFHTDKYHDLASFRDYFRAFESPDPNKTKRMAFVDFLAANAYPMLGDTTLDPRGYFHKKFSSYTSGFAVVLDPLLAPPSKD